MQESLFSQGVSLMIYGLGTVYVFLAILIVVTTALSRLISRYFPETPVVPRPSTFPRAKSASMVEPEVLAAVKAAIEQHRARRR